MDDIIVKNLHESLFIIADEIKRICEKHGIRYFLVAGSMLGAIRHNNIIPWDDDLDIGMLREDYNRFITVALSEIDSKFSVCNAFTEEKCGIAFTKIRAKETFFMEKENPEGLDSGIFVDIFPIDVIPKSLFLRKIQSIFNSLYTKALLIKCGYDIFPSKKERRLVQIVALLNSKRMILKKLIITQTFFNRKKNNIIYSNLCGGYKYGKEVFPFKCFENDLQEYIMGHRRYKLPNYPEECLKLLYGDYLKYPPIEMRRFKHSNGEIKFGNLLEK